MRSAISLTLGAAVLLAGLGACPSSAGNEVGRFNRHGIAFEYPSGWFVTARPLSNAINPVYRFAVSTVRVRRTRADVGPCLPGIKRQLPKDAVLADLREALGSDRSRSLPRVSQRPRSFPLPTRTDGYLCGLGLGSRWIPFKDSGRVFYLGVYIGPRATAQARRALKRLLDEMRIDPR